MPKVGACWAGPTTTFSKPSKAAEAYARAVALQPQSPEIKSAYGEALVAAEAGTVTPKAIEMFNAALALDPGNAKARYFVALAMDQAGKKKEALDAWLVLQAEPLGDEPWVAELRERTQALARELKVDVSGRDSPAATARAAADAPESQRAPSTHGGRSPQRPGAACRAAPGNDTRDGEWIGGPAAEETSGRSGLAAAHTLADRAWRRASRTRSPGASPSGLLGRCVGWGAHLCRCQRTGCHEQLAWSSVRLPIALDPLLAFYAVPLIAIWTALCRYPQAARRSQPFETRRGHRSGPDRADFPAPPDRSGEDVWAAALVLGPAPKETFLASSTARPCWWSRLAA